MNCNLAAHLKTINTSVVLIGYGNDLRTDDGVGKRIAETVARWGVPNVESLAVHQLTPELAATLAECHTAIFVDAYPASEDAGVQVVKLQPAASSPSIGHTGDPQALLALTQKLYGHCPKAWLIAVPAVNFDLGETLSLTTELGMSDALEEIDYLVRRLITQG